MADIAMLVAVEYERRVKDSRKGDAGMLSFSPSCLYELVDGFKNRVMNKQSGVGMSQLVLEPKNQMGLAASHGFFSA